MADTTRIRVLLVEDNKEFAHLVELFLRKHEGAVFDVVWRESGAAALRELDKGESFDVILMDYFLPGQNGLEVTRVLHGRGMAIPVVFLTVNKDFDLAVEAMKLGIDDYLVKEEISTPVLPRTILSVLERRRLLDELTGLEVSQKRLEAIRGLVERVTSEIRVPLDRMQGSLDGLLSAHKDDQLATYVNIIQDNLRRIERKIIRLKELRSDKTIPYVRDIRMFDISDEGKQ